MTASTLALMIVFNKMVVVQTKPPATFWNTTKQTDEIASQFHLPWKTLTHSFEKSGPEHDTNRITRRNLPLEHGLEVCTSWSRGFDSISNRKNLWSDATFHTGYRPLSMQKICSIADTQESTNRLQTQVSEVPPTKWQAVTDLKI